MILEVIGFFTVAYLVIKFFPEILEGVFKFSIIVIGVTFFLILMVLLLN
jgi:hypothetical protein